jgi:hypothetical protein
MSFLQGIDYQPTVDALIKLADQLNTPSRRFLKGELVTIALEEVTNGRLKFVDKEGYDCIDTVTNEKYEVKSVADMFKGDKITGRVSVSNSKKATLEKTFDYLLCVQSDPNKFAIAQLTWDEVEPNLVNKGGQFDLAKDIPVNTWITKVGDTEYRDLPPVKLDVRKLLESVL